MEYHLRSAKKACGPFKTSQFVLKSGHRREEEKEVTGYRSYQNLLRHIVLPKISHPTKMAAPRRARMTHQLTRSGCDRGRVKRIVRRHDIGSAVGFSVFASRYRRRTVKTRREFHRGSRRGRLWCWKESQRYFGVETPVAGLVTAVRTYGTLEEHEFYWKVAKDTFQSK